MQKWDYLAVIVSGGVANPVVWSINGNTIKEKKAFHAFLQELGKEGWELTSNFNNGGGDTAFYFKKPIE